ncbi:ExeM/NucH family extracellular endonuclease [Agromyces sp. SYSU T00266]|uniref:ExeM/NucH family extracellular endonuclease n=1 Tax=Agromyces zhanjiangensis TaxID=3158562 RepID=UPI003396D683
MQRPVQRLTVGLTAAALMGVGIAVPAGAAVAAEGPTDLIISEYVEGTSTNKAVELYNPTDADISLSGYSLNVYFNGSTSSTAFALAGSVPVGGTFVFASNLLSSYAQQATGASLWNGNDAIVLKRGDNVVDSLGQVGSDPGSEWGTGLTSTQDNTIRRNADVCVGDTIVDDVFDPSVEWTGYATNTFDGLGSHTADCGEAGPQEPVINEFSASTAGTDVEYVEILVEPGTDVSGFRVLEIEGDSNSTMGVVDEIVSFDPADGSGRSLAWLPANALENGTVSLLLVSGFTGALGDDLDADDDGTLDAAGFELLDSVAVNDGGAGDLAYGDTVLTVGYDGLSFAPGGASRIPDGVDTDSTADWVRNDFDLAGIPGYTGSLVTGEAANTPGAPNSLTAVVVPLPPADCNAATVSIGSVQGAGSASPMAGSSVQIEGVVVGDFQDGGFDGYYVQDAGDGDPATSDGIFVYAQNGMEVAEGDVVHIAGVVSEFFGMTEITATANSVCETGAALPPAAELTLPATPEAKEALEGMRVTLPQSLSILEYFNFGRYNEIALGTERQMQPTAVYEPGSPEAIALAEENAANRITLDDGRSTENPDPAIHPNGEEFALDNTFRGGDLVTDATGVLDYRFNLWRVQPTQGADYEAVNLRPDVPEVGGNFTVSSFNVLNYFTSIGSGGDFRGANTQEEFDRQEAKIVAALAEIDADVFGLIEIENNDEAVFTLVDALNEQLGGDVYAALDTGIIGTDVITTAFIYKPSEVELAGDFAILDESVDPRFDTDRNRPALAQTFADVETGEEVTVVVNHLKSKGSACSGDPDTGDGQGNCNLTREAAAEAMVDWLATGPTGAEPGRDLIIGDLNSYDKEDPIDVLTEAGYTDLLLAEQGENAYSYVFDGQLGYLDYALAGPGLLSKVTGAAAWAINADEPSLLDYDMTFKKDAQDAIFAPDAFRSSDHDPVLVGFDFVPPELSVTVDPETVFPPNAKWQTVTFDVDASDDSGEVEVELVEATAEGHKADVEIVSDTEARVLARYGAVYTFVFEATDPSGNTTTQEVTVTVGP